MVGWEPFEEEDDHGGVFETPAVEIDESLFTHMDQGLGDDTHSR